MAAIDGVNFKQLDAAIRLHAEPAKRFYADLDGREKPYGGDVSKLNLVDPRDLKGEEVTMHGHAPASRAAYRAALMGDIPSPVNVFSVRKGNTTLGHVTNLGLKNVGAKIDRGELRRFEADKREKVDKAKTRNTYVTGTVTGEGRNLPNAEALGVAPGEMFTFSKDKKKSPLWVASREPGEPSSSGVLGHTASFLTGTKPTVPKAWILR